MRQTPTPYDHRITQRLLTLPGVTDAYVEYREPEWRLPGVTLQAGPPSYLTLRGHIVLNDEVKLVCSFATFESFMRGKLYLTESSEWNRDHYGFDLLVCTTPQPDQGVLQPLVDRMFDAFPAMTEFTLAYRGDPLEISRQFHEEHARPAFYLSEPRVDYTSFHGWMKINGHTYMWRSYASLNSIMTKKLGLVQPLPWVSNQTGADLILVTEIE